MNGKKALAMCGKTLLTALLILGLKATTFAQTTWNVGIIGGGQYVNMSWDGPKTVKMYDTSKAGASYKAWTGRFSYEAGITQELRFGDYFSMQLDLMYSDRGAWHVNSDSSTNYYDRVIYHHSSRDESFQYADGHLLFKFNLPIGYERIVPYDRPGKRVFLSIYGGPYMSYLLGYTSTGYSDTLEIARVNRDSIVRSSVDRTTYTFSNFNNKVRKQDPVLKTDIGVTFGVGINFLIGDGGTFGIDFRYSTGLGSIDNFMYGTKGVSQNDDPSKQAVVYNYANVMHSGMWQALLSYKVKLAGAGKNRNF